MSYARPPANAIQFQFGAGNTNISGIVSAPTPLEIGSFVANGSTLSFLEVDSPLLEGSMLAAVASMAYFEASTPLGDLSSLISIPTPIFVDALTPLGNPSSLVGIPTSVFISVSTPLDSGLFRLDTPTRGFVAAPTPLNSGSFLVRSDVRVLVAVPTPLANPLPLVLSTIQMMVDVRTPLDSGAFLSGVSANCQVSVGTPLANPLPLVRTDVWALVAVPTPLNSGLFVAQGQAVMYAKAESPLGGAKIVGFHDFTSKIAGDYPSYYVVDLFNAAGSKVRIPISSWQATLQSGSANYVQCVIPAAFDYTTIINDATEFVISRRMEIPGVGVIEQLMAQSTADTVVFDQGPERYTCTLSGYTDGFEASEDPLALYDRTLTDIRSISINQGMARVRCSIDWLLRPSQRAYAKDLNFVVGYINYYVNSNDIYMDVGER